MEIVSILSNLEYGDVKPAIKVLLDTDAGKEIRIVFKKGQEMKEHQTNHPIVVQVFEGSIDFGVLGDLHRLDRGMMIALPPAIPHQLTARTDSIVLLSLSKSDTVSRVEKI